VNCSCSVLGNVLVESRQGGFDQAHGLGCRRLRGHLGSSTGSEDREARRRTTFCHGSSDGPDLLAQLIECMRLLVALAPRPLADSDYTCDSLVDPPSNTSSVWSKIR
jgi:hypothetical protein